MLICTTEFADVLQEPEAKSLAEFASQCYLIYATCNYFLTVGHHDAWSKTNYAKPTDDLRIDTIILVQVTLLSSEIEVLQALLKSLRAKHFTLLPVDSDVLKTFLEQNTHALEKPLPQIRAEIIEECKIVVDAYRNGQPPPATTILNSALTQRLMQLIAPKPCILSEHRTNNDTTKLITTSKPKPPLRATAGSAATLPLAIYEQDEDDCCCSWATCCFSC